MLRKLRADRRRRRARTFLELGREFVLEFQTESAGKVEIQVVFLDEGDVLHARITAFYAHGYMAEQCVEQAPVGVRELYRFLETVCGYAAELGYRRLRVSGKRTNAAGVVREQDFSVDVRRFARRGRMNG